MNFSETLTKLNDVLTASLAAPTPAAAPKTVDMTASEFVAHAQAELEKAAKEKEEDEEKAKKRLSHLHKNVARLAKESWSGSNDKVSVEMYDAKTDAELTDTTTPIAGAAGKGTQADGASFAAPGGAQSFAKSLADMNAVIASMVDPAAAASNAAPPPVPTSDEAPPGFWPGDVNSASFMKEGITKRGTAGVPDDWGGDPWAAKR